MAAEKKKEIYTYEAPWLVYGMNWSVRRGGSEFRLAIGSFLEEYSNRVEIVELNTDTGSFVSTASFDHPYPTTKIQWIPDANGTHLDLLGTTGDYLRLWQVTEEDVVPHKLYRNNRHSEFCAPLTSFDWNETDPTMICTASIDTTCTIWDIQKEEPKQQLIAHDSDVYDIAFAKGVNVFASVGADGSMRMFDLRSLEHSTIMYESPDGSPLIRLAWNKQDPNYLSTIMHGKDSAVILDIRVPTQPLAELKGHESPVNALAWAPHSQCHICTAGDDSHALIWDMSSCQTGPVGQVVEDPILAYKASNFINNLQWSSAQPDWVSIVFKNSVQILRV